MGGEQESVAQLPEREHPISPKRDEHAHPATTTTGSVLREIVQTLLTAVIIFVLLRTVVLTYRVEGTSMIPTLHEQQLLLVGRQAYFHFDLNRVIDALPFVERDEPRVVYPFGRPERGDIIILHPPKSIYGDSKPFVKRIIGLPGDRLLFQDGDIYVNGERLDERYIAGASTRWPGGTNPHEVIVPDDAVFVLGDNRNSSTDSRRFGAVPLDDVVGKVWVSLWPADRFGRVR